MSKNKQMVAREEELIQRIIKGDRKASFVLYHRYARQMLNVAFRILKEEEEAKDVLQESFLKAFRELNNLQNPAGFGGWLKRIVVNTAINQAQKKKLFLVDFSAQLNDRYLANEEEHVNENSTWDIVLAKKALMELPNGYRTVLSLYLIEGYDHQEIASILGISVSTSLTQYSRGKKKLIQIINDYKDK